MAITKDLNLRQLQKSWPALVQSLVLVLDHARLPERGVVAEITVVDSAA